MTGEGNRVRSGGYRSAIACAGWIARIVSLNP
jgi:hypothetical protein